MTETIAQQYDSNDASKLIIDKELSLWKEEAQIIEKESVLFFNLLSARVFELSKSRYVNFNSLFDELEYCRVANSQLQNKISNYILKIDGLIECEDLQCENHFLKSHNQFKTEIEEHLNQYRQLKINILSKFDELSKDK